MADSIVQSLFGPTPWQIQQAQNAGLAQAADKYANQDPFQRATGTLYRAGGMLAQPAAEAMGMVNPAMQEAQSREQAMSGIDMSSSDAILKSAQNISDPRLKFNLIALAQQRKEKEKSDLLAAKKFALDERKQDFQETEAFDLKKQSQADKIQLERDKLDAVKAQKLSEENFKRWMVTMQLQGRLDAIRFAGEMKQSGQESKVKPDLPTPALKLQQEELDAIGTTEMINKNLDKYAGQIESKALDLGFVNNLLSRGKNLMGVSDPQSVAFANFKADMEKLRNDSLRLNKGTQTEGDAVRAWNELFENITDPQVVKTRLQTIAKNNEQAAKFRMKNVDVIRKNFKAEPFDFSEYKLSPAAQETQPAAPSQSGWSIKKKN